MGRWVRQALVLSVFVLAPALVAQPAPRRPRGIYAVVNVEENIKKAQARIPRSRPRSWTPISTVFTRVS